MKLAHDVLLTFFVDSLCTGCSLNIVFFPLNVVFFPLNVVIFQNSASSATALVFYLPFSGPCTQRWKTERGKSPEYILEFSKKTQYLMNTLYIMANDFDLNFVIWSSVL